MPRVYCNVPKCNKYAQLTPDGICPRHDKLIKKQKGEVVYNCLECSTPCTDTQKAMLCERCDEWTHSTCGGIDDDVYDMFFKEGKKVTCFRYFCKKCDERVTEALEKYATLEHETQELKKDMVDVKEQLGSITKTIKTSIHENLSTAIDDKREIDKRKMNLIVFGLDEIDTGGNTWSTAEKVAKDIESMSEIIKSDLGIGLSPRNGIIDARRLGMKSAGKTRPLKIEFKDIETKRDVLSKAKNLRDSRNPKVSKLYINPDLSEKQRAIDSALRVKMWELRGEGKNVIIRKGQIIEASHQVRKVRTHVPKASPVPEEPPVSSTA